ncbi:ectin-like [Oculina patagonica]
MVMLLVFLEASSLFDLKVQGKVLKPGKYNISGSIDVLPSGKVNLSLTAKMIGARQSVQPAGLTPTTSASAVTTSKQSERAAPPKAGLTTSPTEANRNAAVGSNERQIGLDTHNQYRQNHNVPFMQLSQELNGDAQRYAHRLARESLFEHDPNNKDQGENIGIECAKGSDADLVKKVVDSWYFEVCDYNFNSGTFSGGTGHFTQVVWKGSTQLGIGFARGSYSFDGKKRFDNCLFVVGRYKEPGNMMNAFKQNVFKGSFKKEASCPPQGSKKSNIFSGKKNAKNLYGTGFVKRMHVF